MKKQSQPTREEKTELAECGIIEALLGCNLSGAVIREFFEYVYKKMTEQEKEFTDTVSGGVQKYTSGNLKRICLRVITGTARLYVTARPRYGEISWPNKPPMHTVVKAKKYKEYRNMLIVSLIYLTGTDDSYRDSSHIRFFRDLIHFWRGELETARVALHLDGKPSYTADIKQVDLFLKIIEHGPSA